MQEINDAIERRLEELFEHASTLVDHYWGIKLHMQDELEFAEWGQYGVRARRRGVGVQIDWSYVYFVGTSNKRSPRSKYISRGRTNYEYNIKLFRKAPDWELKLIEGLEKRFSLIRQESAHLVKLSKQNKMYANFRSKQPSDDEAFDLPEVD